MFVKQNDEELEIEYTEIVDEDGNADVVPAFWFDGEWHPINGFVRCHNTPWVQDVFPEFIHGYEVDCFFNPLYIELVDDCSVNVYRYSEEKNTGK